MFRLLFIFHFTLLYPLLAKTEQYEDVSEHLAKLIKHSAVPSLSAAAILDGKVVSAGASGIRKEGSTEAVTIHDKYHIGSCTKSMTALLATILIEEEKISWDSTIAEVIPNVSIHKGFKNTTLEHLITNTGGTTGSINNALWSKLLHLKGSATRQRDVLVKELLKRNPAYPPGTRQVYSNAGFSIAGSMLEHAARTPYETLLREKVFLPLEMRSAGFRAPAKNGKVDQPYGHHRKYGKLMSVNPEPLGDNPRAIAPAGAVHCNVLDFVKYTSLYLGEHSLISDTSLKRLKTPIKGRDYAKGWIVSERSWAGGTCYSHTGSNTMFNAVMWIAPEKNFTAVAMCNTGEDIGLKKCDEAVSYMIQQHLY